MKKYYEKLKNVSLFTNIGQEDLESMLKCLDTTVKKYEKGNIIYLAGDVIEKIGIVLFGFVKIIKEDVLGNQIIISELSDADIFGEVFICADISQIPVTVIASSNCEIMFIDFKKVISRCASSCVFHSKLIENMMKLLAKKNLLLNNKNEILSKKTIREKVLFYLEEQSVKANSLSFCISFTRNELADYLGVDRSALSRELCKMRDENILKFQKNKFELLNKNF